MDFNEFKKLAMFSPDLSVDEIAALMDISKRSVYMYMSEGISLDVVEKYVNTHGKSLKVEIIDDNLHYQKLTELLVSLVCKGMPRTFKNCAEGYRYDNETIAKAAGIPEKKVEEVLSGKCTDIVYMFAVGYVLSCFFTFEEKRGMQKYDWMDKDQNVIQMKYLLPHAIEGKTYYRHDGSVWEKGTPAF